MCVVMKSTVMKSARTGRLGTASGHYQQMPAVACGVKSGRAGPPDLEIRDMVLALLMRVNQRITFDDKYHLFDDEIHEVTNFVF